MKLLTLVVLMVWSVVPSQDAPDEWVMPEGHVTYVSIEDYNSTVEYVNTLVEPSYVDANLVNESGEIVSEGGPWWAGGVAKYRWWVLLNIWTDNLYNTVIVDKDAQIAALSDALQTSEDKVEALTNQITVLVAEHDAMVVLMQSEIDALNTTLSEKTAALEGCEDENEALNVTVEEMTEELDVRASEISDLNVLLTTCTSELEDCETCPGDFNRDGKVDGADLALFMSVWGSCE